MTWIVFDEPDYIFGSGIRPGVIQRAFITLDSAQQGHLLLQNPVVETGDFKIVIDITTIDSSVFLLSSFTDSDNKAGIFITASGTIQYANKVLGVNTDRIGTGVINDNKFNTIEVERIGTALSITAGGVTNNFTVPVDNLIIDQISGQNAALFFNGIIANVDLGNGNAWPINRLTGNTEQAAGGGNDLAYVNVPTGAPDREIFTLNTSTTPNQWENADKSRIIQVA